MVSTSRSGRPGAGQGQVKKDAGIWAVTYRSPDQLDEHVGWLGVAQWDDPVVRLDEDLRENMTLPTG